MCKQPSGRWDNGNKAHLLCCKVERLLGNRVLKRLTWSLSAAPADLQARQFLFKFWEFTLDEVKQTVDPNNEKQPAAQRVLSRATAGKKQKNKTEKFDCLFSSANVRHSKHSCSKVTYLQCVKKFQALAEMPAARKQVRRDGCDRRGNMCHPNWPFQFQDRLGHLLASAKLKTARCRGERDNPSTFFVQGHDLKWHDEAGKCKLPKSFV